MIELPVKLPTVNFLPRVNDVPAVLDQSHRWICPRKYDVKTNSNYGFTSFTAQAVGQGGTGEAKSEATLLKP